ncbi:MAG: DNA adenine methyltransferase YhdJ [Candidatus Ordinivivax streblomastigis]|uniref:Methyltransferase n=1 Tax=Candidatus Ordinivivax streblomastigis TaxID=2540710 RepID=A0A5M8P0U9_9BACT|nr:MAG: DNA adenine methyltransferase YhdJ [Candidatus Ordinivivax streblomastigis]
MEKQRSFKNQTLQLTAEEQLFWQKKLLHLQEPVMEATILNRTINGDLMEMVDYLPKSFADLIIIDPPYNLHKDFAGMKFKQMSDAEYLEYLDSWFPKIVDLLKPSGSLYLCGDWKCTSALYTIMTKYLTVINRITWQREKGRGAQHNWKNGMEDIWFGVKNPKEYYFDVEAVKIRRKVIAPYKQDGKPKDWEETPNGKFRMTYPSNFWDDITIPYWSMPENTDHPTQKPEKLIAKLILASCPENGIIFDPFLGSGTSSIAAKKLKRNYCGVELNTEYACWAEKRLHLAETNNSIQGYSQGVFWERNSQP